MIRGGASPVWDSSFESAMLVVRSQASSAGVPKFPAIVETIPDVMGPFESPATSLGSAKVSNASHGSPGALITFQILSFISCPLLALSSIVENTQLPLTKPSRSRTSHIERRMRKLQCFNRPENGSRYPAPEHH